MVAYNFFSQPTDLAGIEKTAMTGKLGFRSSKPTKALKRYLVSRIGYGGRTSRQQLLNLFFVPAKGIFFLKQRYIAEIILLHKNLGLLSLNVAHTPEYTMSRDDFLNIVKYEMPDIYFSIEKPETIPDKVVLLCEPKPQHLACYGIEYFRRYFWALLFHAEIHKIQMEWEKEGSISELTVHSFVQKLGRNIFEEARTVLSDENCLFEPDYHKEVVYEFMAYFLEFYNFAPELLSQFFPLIHNPQQVHDQICAFGIDEAKLLEASRPEGSIASKELLAQREIQLHQQDHNLAVFHTQHYLENIYDSPLLSQMGLSQKQFEKHYGTFCQHLLKEVIHNSRIIGELDIFGLMDHALRERLDWDRQQLLTFNKIVAASLSFLYTPASWFSRLLLWLRRKDFLQDSEYRSGRDEISQRTIAKLGQCNQRLLHGKRKRFAWLAWPLMPLLWLLQLLLFVPKQLLYLLATLFEYHASWALSVLDHKRIGDFSFALGRAIQKERQGNIAASFVEHKKAWHIVCQVGRRIYTPEATELYNSVSAAIWQKLKWIEEQFTHEHHLTEEQQAHFKALLEFFMHSQKLERPHRWLLQDIQKSYIDTHKEYFHIDFFGWLFTFGKRKLRALMPAIPPLKKLRALQTIEKQIYRLRLREKELHALQETIEHACHNAEHELREKLGLWIEEALRKAKISPRPLELRPNGGQASATANTEPAKPGSLQQETIAFAKIREELLDQIVEKGYVQFNNLRDIISRNSLKLNDLSNPIEFFIGDQLLKCDKHQTNLLDGVYRGAEIYMRWIHRLNSFLFGWEFGRLVSKYLLLPLVSAFILVETIWHITPLFGKAGLLHRLFDPVYRFYLSVPLLAKSDHFPEKFLWITPLALIILFALFTQFGKNTILKLFRGIGKSLQIVFVHTPQSIWMWRPVQFFYKLKIWAVLNTFLLRPGLYSLPVLLPLLLFTDVDEYMDWRYIILIAIGVFNLLIHNPMTRSLMDAVEETVIDWSLRINTLVLLRSIQLVMELFKGAIIFLEDLMYMVDDFLRFRKGDRVILQLAKAVVGKIWYVITYVFRFTINLVIEPQINPLKHFPIVTVSHKIILPVSPVLSAASLTLLAPILASTPATVEKEWPVVAWAWMSVVFLIVQVGIPGICGFIAWELKENWKLYRRSASSYIKPVLVGSHGEDMLRLLRPGFHSGTIPKLFLKMRKAAAQAFKTGDWSKVHKLEYQQHHICQSVVRFTERAFITQFTNNPRAHTWVEKIQVETIAIYPHQIVIPLALEIRDQGLCHCEIHYQFRANLLFGSLLWPQQKPQWPSELEQYFGFALLTFWKLSGIHLNHELTDRYLQGELTWEKRYTSDYLLDGHLFVLQLFRQNSFKLAARVGYSLREELIVPEIIQPLFGHTLDKPMERAKLLFKFQDLAWEDYNQAAAQYITSGLIPAQHSLPLTKIKPL